MNQLKSKQSLTVNYSVGSILYGGGLGDTAYNAALGIFQKGWLKGLFVSDYRPNVIDLKKITSFGIQGKLLRQIAAKLGSVGYRWHDQAFDRFVSVRLTEADIFHGWNQHCLLSLKKAKTLGSKTIVERASSHLLTAKALLEEEYRRFQAPLVSVDEVSLQRGLEEFELADFITVPSDFAYQSFLNHQFSASKIKKIPFGVDLAKFRPRQSEESGRPFRFLFVGQISLRKGVQYLLPAWEKLNLPNVELVLAGAVQPDLQSFLKKTGLPANTKIQYFSAVEQAYQASDVFVFPSLEEGMALVTLEALASGLPTITTLNSGSIIKNNQEGFIVPIRNTEALTQKMKQLYEDKQTRQKMAKAARLTAEKYSWDQYRTNLLDFYQTLI